MTSRFLLPPAMRIFYGSLLALAVVGVSASEARTGTPAHTLVVDGLDGMAAPGNCNALAPAFTSISDAVAAASPGDTIEVCPFIYAENIVIGIRLTLKGAQAGNPGAGRTIANILTESIVRGSVTIQATSVTLDGFWLTAPALQPTMLVVKTAGSDAVIVNNVVDTVGNAALPVLPPTDQPSVGIYLERGPDRVKLMKNRVSNIDSQATAQGILVGDSVATDPSRDILISNNLIELIDSRNAGAYGIQINNGTATTTGFTTVAIRDNTIRSLVGGGWAHAIGLEGPTPNVEVKHNSISDVVDETPVSASPEIQDAVAVFFENNKFFPTADVNRNDFNVTPLVAFGIALHPDLIASQGYRGKVDGSCNWWNAPDGPGPVGPGSGARVTTNVDFTPWLEAPGGNCVDPHDKCDKDDDDDHDHDGKRNDKDEDVDNDGILNLLDLDDDNDGITDLVDVDDDNDGIADLYDDKSTRQVQRTLDHILGAGAISEWMLASDGGALPLVALLESPNAQFLRVDVYNPSGVLVGTSVPTPGVAVVTTSGLLPGIYTVRVRNTGVAPIDYTIKLITTIGWF